MLISCEQVLPTPRTNLTFIAVVTAYAVSRSLGPRFEEIVIVRKMSYYATYIRT
jgi:hypothetical protein